MVRGAALLVAFGFVLLSIASASSASQGSSITAKVYSDGFVQVTESIPASASSTSVSVELLTPVVQGVVAVDQSGSPLSYSFGGGGSNLTIYTLGATEVVLTYSTDSLTSKNGTVWTLQFVAPVNSTVVLPQGSTLSSVSAPPGSLNVTGGSPIVGLSPGAWKLEYGVPIGSTTTTAGGGTTTAPGGGPLAVQPTLFEGEALVGVIAAVLVGAALYFRYWRRRVGVGSLRPDDVKVLEFIREKGGKVVESEIRMKFALPKTSAWRQIRRLERLGLVRVTKVGSVNQVEISRDRTPA